MRLQLALMACLLAGAMCGSPDTGPVPIAPVLLTSPVDAGAEITIGAVDPDSSASKANTPDELSIDAAEEVVAVDEPPPTEPEEEVPGPDINPDADKATEFLPANKKDMGDRVEGGAKKALGESIGSDGSSGPLAPPAMERPSVTADIDPSDAALDMSIRIQPYYWYYPPAPARCAGQLYDPFRYFCCDGTLHYKYFYYRYYYFKRQTYYDSCCCGQPFNSQVQFCCKDKIYDIHKIGQPGYIGCCKHKAYSKREKICCEGKLFDNTKGCLQCCGCDAYNVKDSLCCSGVKIPRLQGKDPMRCCGTKTYHPPTQRCCGNCIQIRKNNEYCCGSGVATNKEICCGGRNYPSSIYNGCCYNPRGSQYNQPYNGNTHICCGGRVYHKKPGVKWGCCSCYYRGFYSSRIYDTSTQKCCGCRVYNMPNKLYTGCCCNYNYHYYYRYCPYYPYYYYYPQPYYYHFNYPTCRLYPPTYYSCCNGQTIYPKLKPGKEGCCNQKRYRYQSQMCCNGEVHTKYNTYYRCCGTASYDSRRYTCCYNQIISVVNNKRACCGYETYNPSVQKCCDGHVVRGYSGWYCCGRRAYPWTTHGCCNGIAYYKPRQNCCQGNRISGGTGHSCCGHDKTYDRKTHFCCCNCIHKRQNLLGYTDGCCGEQPYDRRTHVCCWSTQTLVQIPPITIPGRPYTWYCCYRSVYNLWTHRCCNDKVIPRSNTCY